MYSFTAIFSKVNQGNFTYNFYKSIKIISIYYVVNSLSLTLAYQVVIRNTGGKSIIVKQSNADTFVFSLAYLKVSSLRNVIKFKKGIITDQLEFRSYQNSAVNAYATIIFELT